MPERLAISPTEKEKVRGIERAIEDPVGAFLESMPHDIDIDVASSIDVSYLTPAQRAESMWAVYQNVKDTRRSGLKAGKKTPEKSEENNKFLSGLAEDQKFLLGLALLQKFYSDPETKSVYEEGYVRHQVESRTLNGEFERYKDLERKLKTTESSFDAAARNIFGKRGTGPDEIDTLVFESQRKALARARADLEKLTNQNPDLAALAEYNVLEGYAEDLRREGFAWAPSRRALLEDIELAALSGKPILLSGESGTGKTRLVEQVALTLTNRVAAETPGKDVRFQDLIAKRDIATDGSTYYRYQEIGEAATGKETTADKEPTHSGRVVADDEFNLLPSEEQTGRLARIATWTPGKKVRMPVTNEEVTIGSNFLYCAMVNLASERYDRKKIPPEVLRKFAKVDVDYLTETEENPELYEVMLASLMDSQGRIQVAVSELSPKYKDQEEVKEIQKSGQPIRATVRTRKLVREVEEGGRTVPAGGFLWRFAEALNELNKSFAHKETVLKAKGEAQYIKEFVLDVGTATGWLREYQSAGRGMSLEAFVVDKINSQFLKREAYTKEDRALVKEFLRHFGINTDKEFDEEDKPEFTILTPKDIGLLSPRVRYTKISNEQPIVKESYFIDGEGKRIEYRIAPYNKGAAMYEPGDVITQRGKKMRFKGVNKKNDEPVFEPYKEEIKAKNERRSGPSLEKAKEIMGAAYEGPEAVKATWGTELRPDQIPSIPFTIEELERAKELNQVLRLRFDKDPSGNPLTMSKMRQIIDAGLPAGQKTLWNTDWYKGEKFFTTETPQSGWALVSKEPLESTKSKNYVGQTEQLIAYLTTEVFKNSPLPADYQAAVDEFNTAKAGIAGLIAAEKWQDTSLQLSKLTITQLLRPSMAETMYDAMLEFKVSGKRVLPDKYAWSSTRSSDGYLVNFGYFYADGAHVYRWKPDDADGGMRSLFARRV
jgi:energy-coupling factor transporter ATP-binding protein EcfA2